MSDHLSVAASIAGLITIADIVYLESDDYKFNPATQIHYVNACQKSLLRIQEQLDAADPTSTSGATKLKKKLKWPFEKHKTEELLADIEKHKATMTLAMSADQMSVLLDLLRRGEVIQKKADRIHSSVLEMQGVQHRLVGDKTKQKMLQYLGKLDIENWQRPNLALRQPGTGIWFTDGEEFNAWTSTGNSKLWIYGIPGAGKTILVSSIIQELSNSVGDGRAFFYCDYKDPQTHDPVTIFGALAKQLAVQNELCPQELERFYTAHIGLDGLERRAKPDELCELIRSLAMHLDESMIIVDGLDEISRDRSDVTRLLAELSKCLSIKVILSSRPEIDIRRRLSSFTPISIAACSADLQLYVASEIEKRISSGSLTISDPLLKEEIMRTLVERAEGM
ncbi:hypothetical protein NA56DRAFT_752812 [Hyaloscypha hepaticicola]|uniref:NACHT domain-containing protein n=1 Tax=Hyaloscypha hepaticicola TaxID=2082293 RepID=A0A2J6PS31_9HELO|nr:hypothetical protein NA56DRAFT_752812 [Hyaloscypha hepaticicola]